MIHRKTHCMLSMVLLLFAQLLAVALILDIMQGPKPDSWRLNLTPTLQFWVALPAFGLIIVIALYWGVAADSSDALCLVTTSAALLTAFMGINSVMQRLFAPAIFESASSPPETREWITYTLVHLLHASDVLDLLHEYRVSFSVPRASSPLAKTTLVGFNIAGSLIFGLLLISCAPGAARAFGRRLEASRRVAILAVGAILVAIAATAFIQKWKPLDWLAWPADNLLRAVDVGDAMQVYDVRLHGVEFNLWVGALAVTFRLAVGAFILGWLSSIRLTHIGGLGLSIPALIDEVIHGKHPWAALQILRNRRPSLLGPFVLDFAEPPKNDVTDPAIRRALFELILIATRDPRFHQEGLFVPKFGPEAARYPGSTVFCSDGTCRLDLWQFIPPRLADKDAVIADLAERVLASLPAGQARNNVVVRMTGILGHPVEISGCKQVADSRQSGPVRQKLRAVSVLAKLGLEASAATPALIAVFQDARAPRKLRLAAVNALKVVNPDRYAKLPKKKKDPPASESL